MRYFFSPSLWTQAVYSETLRKIQRCWHNDFVNGERKYQPSCFGILRFFSFPTDVAAEGIFRISGSKKRQDELRHLLDKDIDINFEEDAFTEHDVASILKYFLAELPEPIVTNAHIKVHMQISGR